MNIKLLAAAAILIYAASLNAALLPGDHRLGAVPDPGARLPSNSIIDIVPHGRSVWLGTGSGLAELHLDNGQWSNIGEAQGIGKGGISALAVTDTLIWAATAFSEKISGTFYPAGGGVGYSRDGGVNWTWMKQPIDSADVTGYSPTTTNVQNVTYDIALTEHAVWIVSWGGGLRRLPYGTNEWQLFTVDDHPFAPLVYLAHRTFAAVYDGQSLWVGSAAGVHRTVDEGQHWVTYGFDASGGGALIGNFVVALGVQKIPSKTLVWAATWKAENALEYYGVCVTEDDGAHWRVALSDSTVLPNHHYLLDDYGNLHAHNFGFKDSTVYVAADGGLWQSNDLGHTWGSGPLENISDPTINDQIDQPDFFSAASTGDSVIVGTDDGAAIGWFDGSVFNWRLHRAYQPAGVAGQPATYAYPSPFPPKRSQIARLQFPLTSPATVSFEIFDFGMEPVYSSTQLSLHGGGVGDMAGYGAVTWNGYNGDGNLVANGVYFYRIKAAGKTYWGKVMVLD